MANEPRGRMGPPGGGVRLPSWLRGNSNKPKVGSNGGSGGRPRFNSTNTRSGERDADRERRENRGSGRLPSYKSEPSGVRIVSSTRQSGGSGGRPLYGGSKDTGSTNRGRGALPVMKEKLAPQNVKRHGEWTLKSMNPGGAQRDLNTESFYELTPEQWATLTPEQQAGVQFNADLQTAANRDKANKDTYKPTSEQKRAYNDAARRVFGSAAAALPGGMEYAPETVALLDQMGLRPDTVTGRLADYVNLDAVLSATDLGLAEALGRAGEENGATTFNAQRRGALSQALISGQAALQKSMSEEGKPLLLGTTGRMANLAAQQFGASSGVNPMWDRLSSAEKTLLEDTLETISIASLPDGTAPDQREVLAAFDADLDALKVSTPRRKELTKMLRERAELAAMNEADWYVTGDSGYIYHDPQTVAGFFGTPELMAGG